jgi:hypothetical protein
MSGRGKGGKVKGKSKTLFNVWTSIPRRSYPPDPRWMRWCRSSNLLGCRHGIPGRWGPRVGRLRVLLDCNKIYRKFSDFKLRLIEQSNILRCHQICVQNGQSAYSIFKTLYADWAIAKHGEKISYNNSYNNNECLSKSLKFEFFYCYINYDNM